MSGTPPAADEPGAGGGETAATPPSEAVNSPGETVASPAEAVAVTPVVVTTSAPSIVEPMPPLATAVEPPSPDVALADEASPLPGAHRGGFQRLPTAPVAVTTESAPELGADGDREPVAQWLMPAPAPVRRGLANWALVFSIGGLLVSLFVGWGFPIGLVGIVSAILALRRPLESRAVAIWALVLGILSVLYSAGWLVYAASSANPLG